jgi:hypothetical protein
VQLGTTSLSLTFTHTYEKSSPLRQPTRLAVGIERPGNARSSPKEETRAVRSEGTGEVHSLICWLLSRVHGPLTLPTSLFSKSSSRLACRQHVCVSPDAKYDKVKTRRAHSALPGDPRATFVTHVALMHAIVQLFSVPNPTHTGRRPIIRPKLSLSLSRGLSKFAEPKIGKHAS